MLVVMYNTWLSSGENYCACKRVVPLAIWRGGG